MTEKSWKEGDVTLPATLGYSFRRAGRMKKKLTYFFFSKLLPGVLRV